MKQNRFQWESSHEQVKRQLDKAAQLGMEKVLRLVKAAAKSGAPVDTGQLRDRINAVLKVVNGEVIGMVGSPEQYAIYVEFGTGEFAENGAGRKGGWFFEGPDGEWHFTRGQKPQKFLRTAFRENKDQIIALVGDEYQAIVTGG